MKINNKLLFLVPFASQLSRVVYHIDSPSYRFLIQQWMNLLLSGELETYSSYLSTFSSLIQPFSFGKNNKVVIPLPQIPPRLHFSAPSLCLSTISQLTPDSSSPPQLPTPFKKEPSPSFDKKKPQPLPPLNTKKFSPSHRLQKIHPPQKPKTFSPNRRKNTPQIQSTLRYPRMTPSKRTQNKELSIKPPLLPLPSFHSTFPRLKPTSLTLSPQSQQLLDDSSLLLHCC